MNSRTQTRLIAAAATISLVCMIFGWQQRIGRRWIARIIAQPQGALYNRNLNPWHQCPIQLSPSQERAMLAHLIADLPTADERFVALVVLVDVNGREALPALVHAAATGRDENLLASELRLTGLCRDAQTASLLIAKLQDPRPPVRAAAADTIGILRHPSYSICAHSIFWIIDSPTLDTTPPIEARDILVPNLPNGTKDYAGDHDLINDPVVQVEFGSIRVHPRSSAVSHSFVNDRARQCPMQVRPAPTEVVRLGRVLTEFGTADARR